jgi:hypothetical protein
MPNTARKHFDEDIARAEAIWMHADGLPSANAPQAALRADLLRSALMYAVGAMDAYFCDAYADLVARTLRAKSIQGSFALNKPMEKLTFPVGAIFAPANQRDNWRWRNATRSMIEKDNMLSIDKICTSFNPFLRNGHKFFEAAVMDEVILLRNAPRRLTGQTATDFRRLNPRQKDAARKRAKRQFRDRFDAHFQRRHDCIHNCDRPKQSPQTITAAQTRKVIDDVRFFVGYADAHVEAEFDHFLRRGGATGATRGQVGYGA